FLELSVIAEESKAVLVENLKKRIQDVPIEPYEISFRDKTGVARQFEVKGKKISCAGQPANIVVLHDVTRRRKNEQRLTQYVEHMETLVKEKVREIQGSEEKLRGIFDSVPDPVAISSLDSKIIDCNPAALETFGYSTKSEVIGRNVFDFFAEKDRARALESLGPERLTVKNEEYFFQTKNGREFPGVLSSNPVFHSSGEVAFFVTIIKDITERKNNEAKLRLSEEQFRHLFFSMPSGVAVYEAVNDGEDFVFKDFNAAAETIEKISRENIIGKRVTQVFPGVKSFGLFKVFQRVWHSGQPEYYPVALYKDERDAGTWRENWVYKLPNGYIVAIYEDITKRKNAELALACSEEKFRIYVESSPVAVFVVNSEGKYEYVNNAACRLLGYSKTELLEMSILQVVFKQDNQVDRDRFLEVKATGRSVSETALKTKDGLPVYVILNSVKLPDGKLMAFCENITERIEMQRKLQEYSRHLEETVEKRTKELKEANAKLLRSERLAAIGELAGMIGHDLRNPLTGIKNAAYYLKKKGDACTEANNTAMLEIIENAVERANKIVNDLLDYSREIHLDLEERTPCLLLAEALMIIEVPDRIRLLDQTHDEPKMLVDVDKMTRVFVNLIKNAIDAMPKGGTLEVRSSQKSGKVEFAFVDEGTGIPEEVMAKLFSPLFTTKAQGMGFGLAICKRIIEAQGGEITVETAKGKGSTFTVTLPIKPKTEIGGENVWINLPESLSLTTTKA
ncbi:MAG: PAS domain-containing sensor histidine kinase, partial [Candidatus Bathyarchaeia archaeon]